VRRGSRGAITGAASAASVGAALVAVALATSAPRLVFVAVPLLIGGLASLGAFLQRVAR
jgi:hypothetical protein